MSGNDIQVPLTVLVATRNEQLNIAECLERVVWADQRILIDSWSVDRTVEIARQYGAEVYQFRYDGGWPKKRNWALRHLPIRNDWVLVLDADERVTPELAEEIRWAIRQDEYDGFYTKWRFIFLGRWMKHSWSHGWMLRLLRHGKGEYEDIGMRGEGGWDAEVHENIRVQGRCGRLKGLLEHRSNQGLSSWIRKQNEFSDWNAHRRLRQRKEPVPPIRHLLGRDPVQRRKWLKAIFVRMPWTPTWLFIWLYFVRRGFLDGRAGFFFCRLRAMHELNIRAKLFELSQRSVSRVPADTAPVTGSGESGGSDQGTTRAATSAD